MGIDEAAGDERPAEQPSNAANDPSRMQLARLRKYLKCCRPDWSRQSIGTVVEKLGKVGVHEIAALQESIRLGTLNSSLEQAGEKRFNTDTLELMRMGPQVLKPMIDIDDDYHEFPELRYFRITVRCVAAQCAQSLDARRSVARCRGEVVEAVGRAGSWLRLTALEGVLDGERGGEPIWLQISSNTREDGRVAQEAESSLLLLRGIYPEALGPAVDSRGAAEGNAAVQLCSAVEEVKDSFGRAVHTQEIVKRCSNVRHPPLDDTAFDPRRLLLFFTPTIQSPGTGRLQARRGPGARVHGLGQWRVFADRDYEPGEVIETCPCLTASCEAKVGSVLDRRMEFCDDTGVLPRRLPLGLGCLYRRANASEANACMVMRADLDLAFVQTTRQVHAGEELILPSTGARRGPGQPLPRSQDDPPWVASRVGLTAGAARLGNSPVHGRGVFAATTLRENDVVELCPGLVIDEGSQGPLQDFAMLFFEHSLSYREAAKPISVIALGHGAMYNHKNPGYNLEWGFVEGFDIIEMRAARDIEEGEELFISYGANYWKDRRKPG